jgi:hypothetical protein
MGIEWDRWPGDTALWVWLGIPIIVHSESRVSVWEIEAIQVIRDRPFRQQRVTGQGQVCQIVSDVIHGCIVREVRKDFFRFDFDLRGRGWATQKENMFSGQSGRKVGQLRLWQQADWKCEIWLTHSGGHSWVSISSVWLVGHGVMGQARHQGCEQKVYDLSSTLSWKLFFKRLISISSAISG